VFFAAGSFPNTLVAKPWIAVHEFPQSPDKVVVVSRPAFEACALAERTKEDVGADLTLDRDGAAVRAGDAAWEPKGEVRSLPEVG
jgi:hypothetical protein